jgi:FkbM family methyltransferase
MKKIELNSKEFFNIIDIGSDIDLLEKVVNYLSCDQNLHCINPNKRDLEELEIFFKKNNKVNFKKLNYAVSDVSGNKTFYITKDDSASSIYEPNEEILKRYRRDDIFDVVEKKEVQCETLDNVFLKENINNIDLLLLLCQASELSILKGSGKILEKISIIHADASFIEKYKNQPLFDDYVSFLGKNNFKFVGFTHTRSVDGNIVEVRALFINKKLNKNNNITNAAKILIFFGFFWEAKWLLHDNNVKKEIYSNLINFKMKKNAIFFKIISFPILKIMPLKKGFIRKILYLVIPLIKKTKIGNNFLTYLDSLNKKTR